MDSKKKNNSLIESHSSTKLKVDVLKNFTLMRQRYSTTPFYQHSFILRNSFGS